MENINASSNNTLKKILLITSSSITGIILITLISILQTSSRLLGGIESLFFAAPAIPKADITNLIIHQIKGLNELTTASFVMETIVPTSQERKIGGMVVGETKLLYIAHGEVKAGINLDALTPDNIKVNNNSISIQLPPPQILDRKIDLDRSKVYDYDRGFLNLGPDVAYQLQTLAQRQTLTKIVAAACHEGLLEEANERASVALTQLFLTTGYKQVNIKTIPPSTTSCN